MDKEKLKVIYLDLLKEGGNWLGAARMYVQTAFRNGEQVTWGSNDELKPAVTIRQLEEACARAVAADRNAHTECEYKEIENITCQVSGCGADAEYEGWWRRVDGFGLTTGMMCKRRVCEEHKSLLIGGKDE